MHICFLTHEYPKSNFFNGGVGTFVQTLARELIKNDFEVSVVGTNYTSTYEEENDQGVHIYRLPASALKGLQWYFNFKNINLHINPDSAEFFPVLFYEKSKTLNASYLQNYTFGFIEFEKWNEKIKVSTVNGKRVDDYNNYFKENYGITYTIHPDEIIAELFTEWLLDDKMVMEADGLESKTFEAFTEIFNTRYQ